MSFFSAHSVTKRMDDPTMAMAGGSSNECEDGRGTRQKRANVLFANEIDPTTKTFREELRKSNSIWRQQQRESAVGIPLHTTTGVGNSAVFDRVIALPAREQEQIRIENNFVTSNKVFKPRQQKPSVESGTDPMDPMDMMEAIQVSVQTCSAPLVDWNQNAAKLIGATCKIYWDGEDEWFYARILNYDRQSDRHYVYYYTDSTSEWLSIRDEFIFVAEALVLAKMGGSWPALRFWISPHAWELLKTIKGYRKNCEYVEFFAPTRDHVMQKQFAFLPASQFDPLSEEYFPSKPSKSFDICMENARKEKLEMCAIVDSIVQTIRKNLFTSLVGSEWVGVRVRASTHRIITPEELQEDDFGMVEPVMVRCIGKIVSYNASADQHLVVFDESLLQPQWVRARPESIDVLLGPESSGYNEPVRIASLICLHTDPEALSSSSSLHAADAHPMPLSAPCLVCGTAVNACAPNDESSCSAAVDSPSLKCRDCSRFCHEKCLPRSSVPTDCLNSECGVFSIRGHGLSWYSLQECEQGEKEAIKSKGANRFQSKATEKRDIGGSSSSSSSSSSAPASAVREDWLCFDCLKCEGCGETSSSKALLQWNVKRVSPGESFADRPIPICADCMVRFKKKQDYCPVCYKFYDLEDEPTASPLPSGTVLSSSPADELVQGKDKGKGEESNDREPAVDDDIFNGFVSFADENVRMPSSANAGSYKPARCGKRGRRVRRRPKIAAVAAAVAEEQHNLSSELDAINKENETDGFPSKKYRSTSPLMDEGGALIDSSLTASSAHLDEPVVEETFIKTGIGTEGQMVQCNECVRWVHAKCELIDEAQYHAMSKGSHPVWGSEYLCPHCRVAITKEIVAQLQAADQWTVFAAPVDEAVARDYYDVIRHPMDLSTMRAKAERGQYKSMQSLREDFELMCLNAMVYNKEDDEWWTAARDFEARGQEVFRSLGRRTQPTAFGAEIAEILEAHGHKALQKATDAEAARRGKKMAGTTKEGCQPMAIVGSADQPAVLLNAQQGDFAGAECQECLHVEEAKVMLPDALVDPYADDSPNEYTVGVAYTLPGDQAFFSCSLDQCLVCGSSGAVESMLFCCDCGEAFHAFCAEFPLPTMSAEARLLWRCAKCKICNVCGDAAAMNDAITCASCHISCHFGCLIPAMSEQLPAAQWFCSDCVSCSVCQWDEIEGTDDNDARDLIHSNHSWGTSRKLCWECQSASSDVENIRGSCADGTLVAMEIGEHELEAAACTLDNGNVCYLCEGGFDKGDGSSHDNGSWEAVGCVTCPQCSQLYHTSCAGDTCLPWIAAAAHDFRCPACLVALSETEVSEWTHLHHQMTDHAVTSEGSSDDALEGKDVMLLLMQVAEIQRKRYFEKLAKKEKKRDVLEAILLWAAGRVARLGRDSNSFVADNHGSSSDDASWLLPRATRFVAMCRQEKLAAAVCGGSQMPIKILSRLAAMASAYLKVTRQCQNSVEGEGEDAYASIVQVELAPICLAIIARRGDLVDESGITTVEALSNEVIGASQTLLSPRPISSVITPAECIVSGNDQLEVGSQFDATLGFRTSLLAPTGGGPVNGLPLRRIKSQMDRPSPVLQHLSVTTLAHDDCSASAAVSVKRTVAKQLVSCDLQRGGGFYARKARMYQADDCQGATTTIDSTDREGTAGEGVLRESAFVRALAATVERARAEVLEQFQQKDEGAVHSAVVTSNSLDDVSTVLHEMVDKVVASAAKTVVSQSSDNDQSASMLQSPPELSVNIDLDRSAEGHSKLLLSRRKDKETNATASGVDVLAGWSSRSIPTTAEQNGAATASSCPSRPLTATATFPAWSDPRSCCLCHTVRLSACDNDNDEYSRCLGDDAVCGRLLPLPDGSYAHVNCLRWSSEAVEMRGKLFLDIADIKDVVKLCALCRMKGATVGCMVKSCKRLFHLRCALASNCCLMEARASNESADSPHAIYPLMACPEHFSMIDRTTMNCQWVPEDPKRSLFVASACNPCQPESGSCMSLSNLIAQGHKADRALRVGGLTVHAIGMPRIYSEQDADCFHSATRIFPHRYRASRIFWSMRRAWRRTLYVFEVCAEGDIGEFHEGMLLENQAVAAANTHSQSGAEPSTTHMDVSELAAGLSSCPSPTASPPPQSIPIFRIVAVDLLLADDDEDITSTSPLPQQPMLTRSIDYAYNAITSAVAALLAADVARRGFRPFSRSNARTFGRSAAQFFGLGLPVVKQAIEMIPDSHAAMIAAPPAPQYRPCYVLPTQELADRVYRMQMQQALSPARRVSVHGSSRADGIDLLARAGRPRGGTRVTRVLSKATNDNHNVNDEASSSRHPLLDDRHNEEIREENERYRLRYAELSAAYLRDPFARLQVRKSSIHGGGLFTAPDAAFEKDEMIVEYIGQVVRQAVADRREVQYEEQGLGSCYLFRVDKDSIVDATKHGGIGRFINHSCDPNAYAKIIETTTVTSSSPPSSSSSSSASSSASSSQAVEVVERSKHIIIFAARGILGGEEITYDYKFPIEDKKLRCYCGAPRCQGSMN